ncbi:hypothetical protein H6B10_17430, partial [Gemmiger formicilis]|uniref:hypothetical protein n=1 Tax=Gemmiger formicilis TaxID=745368 RepID=UPI00195890FD
ELSQAVVVEVAHGDGFHPLPDGHALIGRHEVPGVGLLDGKTGSATAWQALGLLAVSILGSAVTKYFSQLQQT